MWFKTVESRLRQRLRVGGVDLVFAWWRPVKDGLPLPECLESDTSSLPNHLWTLDHSPESCSIVQRRITEWERRTNEKENELDRAQGIETQWTIGIRRSLPSVPEEVQSASLFSSLTGCKRVKSEHIVPELKIIRTSAVATISSLCPSSWETHRCALKRKDLLDTHLLGGCDSEMDHVFHF